MARPRSYHPQIWADEDWDRGRVLSDGGQRVVAGRASARGFLVHQDWGGGGRFSSSSRYARTVAGGIRTFVRGGTKDFRGSVEGYVSYLDKHATATFLTADREGLSLAEAKALAVGRTLADPHAFGVYFAPHDGDLLGEHMVAFVRGTMARYEERLGCRLDWVAAIHEQGNAASEENAHFHVFIPGTTADGTDLYFRREFVRGGFRECAEEQATEMLGPMSPAERQALTRQMEAHREWRAELKRERERRLEGRAAEPEKEREAE